MICRSCRMSISQTDRICYNAEKRGYSEERIRIMNKQTYLLTGGTGFIGSHTAVELLEDGHQVVLLDDLSNSDEQAVDRIEQITGVRPAFRKGDVSDKAVLRETFAEYDISGVVHFAGFKAVGESVEKPLEYYRNNLDTTLSLLEVMREYGVSSIVFSSSSTVYGTAGEVPFRETAQTGNCINPYGWTKHMNEQILRDAAAADKELSVVLLRYFNPVGAHPSGLIGERPSGIPNNLMPYITMVAAGALPRLSVFGDDYPTHDGTGVRDYIHVVDLAAGHKKALEYAGAHTGCESFNLGTGKGYSVLDLVKTFERVNHVSVPYVITERRNGDIAVCYADPEKAERVLGWKAVRGIEEMCEDSWRFASR